MQSRQLQGQLQTQHSVATGNYKGQTRYKVSDRLRASTGGRRRINTEITNKQKKTKDEDRYIRT
jgi:hypothetical protein